MLKAVSNEQISVGTNNSVQSIIPVIGQQNAMLRDHGRRLENLETRSSNNAAQPTIAEMAVASVGIARKFLEALKIPHLKADILEARSFVKKAGSNISSVIVSFKSNFARDFVILTKRKFGRLEQTALLGVNCSTDQIYVTEFLNLITYKLLMEAKKWKRESNWVGFIWVQNSQIFARKDSDRSLKVTVINC